jgi:hypothetical protein
MGGLGTCLYLAPSGPRASAGRGVGIRRRIWATWGLGCACPFPWGLDRGRNLRRGGSSRLHGSIVHLQTGRAWPRGHGRHFDLLSIFRRGSICCNAASYQGEAEHGEGSPAAKLVPHLTIGSSDRGSCGFGEPRRESMMWMRES